ncbi:MAG TPA: GNAT family N-acetyltransferase [Saprospiraceae bacterium]|nr:GNAT family N-acetyltransferase [Saprospiraceae bacterium]HMQ85074.1 GNAT family N-acetyltransferase [Saprospiraceae bacterium]
MTIHTATLSDLPALSELFDAYRVFYGKESDLAGAHAFLGARLELGEAVIYMAKNQAGTAVGFVQLYPLFSSTRMKRLWLLNDLYVGPEWRGQGISIALIDAAKDWCRSTGACGLLLETAKDNDIGNQLYPRTGFVLDQDHNFYYWDV